MHGLSGTPFYNVWANMKSRCFNLNHNAFKYYGDRGITVCKEWLDFMNFKDNMYADYLDHKANHTTTTIERIDTNGNYCPENCCWATMEKQSFNRQKPPLYKSPNIQEYMEATDKGQLICKRCGHTWWPRSNEKPQLCPACKSRKWDVERVKKDA